MPDVAEMKLAHHERPAEPGLSRTGERTSFSAATADRREGGLPVISRNRPDARNDGSPRPHATLSDEELMRRYRDTGDATAFTELVRRYQPGLTGYLRRFVRDAAAAEDLCQLTFEHVHRWRAKYESGRPPRPWIYRIATHLAIDWLRYSGRHPAVSLQRTVRRESDEGAARALVDLLPDSVAAPVLLAEGHESGDWARHAMDDLPDHLRETLGLIYFRGLKYAEAARELGIPVGTVKSRVHQALERLRRAWSRDTSPPVREEGQPGSS